MHKLPIGVSDFKEIIENDYYYVDKSLLIKDIIDDGSKVILLPRPRRFGKTLNLSMLSYFFEKGELDNSSLFEELSIQQAGEEYLQEQGKYPIIMITFKDIKEETWERTYIKLKQVVAREYKRHRYLLDSDLLDKYDKEQFHEIISLKAELPFYEDALRNLSEYLANYHQEKTIILIDEYDQPIQQGYLKGFYQEVMSFMRNILSGGLKDNPNLNKGVLTGILRVAKESIFSGLNNLLVSTLLDIPYDSYFGLLEEEVEEIFDYYNLTYKVEEIKSWYNGYKFGEKIVYNPWSIINCIYQQGELRPYWANTSGNELIKRLITESGSGVKKDLEHLLEGSSVKKEIDDNIIFSDLEKSNNTIWSFLLLSGYLKASKQERKLGHLYCELEIPNIEVEYIYRSIILDWFKENLRNEELEWMLKSLTEGDIETFTKIFKEIVESSFSYFDIGRGNSENFYHAFVLGLMVNLRGEYQVKSNRESGYGRYDVMLIPNNKEQLGIVMEFKKVGNSDSLEEGAKQALEQIKDRNYRSNLMEEGITEILEIGLAFQGKRVLVLSRD
ncbi:PD-(D/E)XK nuclease superfamily protein [Orenia metallireducens]|uniref:PD-(D/E)XK nuclease superfamily protein n=1 Tax=Orenia metallireducens TaxID=1413210 RepID=A0A285IAE5_9FIRM|nr:AAA family ATPase [Orenia metallireducens]PRX21219.1 PD-(D/E)XK nuclease superfamily protein [Orenia metallireducens]SNY44949.1 PD-(D/E)XK nuclease superfamily protein [Orenia metallireducens]